MLLPSKPFTKKWSLRIILSNNVKFVIPIDSSKDIRHLKNFIYGYIKQIFGYEYKILTVLDSEGFFLSQNFKIKDILKNRDIIHCFDTELSFGKYKLKEELNTEKIQIVCNDKSNVFDLSNKSLENIESHNKDICRRISKDKSRNEDIVKTPSKCIEGCIEDINSKDKSRNEDIVKTPSKCIEDINSSILEKNNIKKEKNENLLQNKETEIDTDIEKTIKSAVDLSQIGIKKKRKSKDLNKTDKNKEIKNYKSFDKNEETNVEIMFDQRKDIEVVSNLFDKNEETNVAIMFDQRKDIEAVSNKSLKENKINIDLGNEKILVEQEVIKEMEEETDNGSNTNQKTRVVRKTALKKEISKNSLPKNSLPKISKSKSVNSTPKKNITTEVKMVSARKSKKTCDFSLDEI
ncbi:hypothetical protein CWI39_0676p0020 [Hamiltosporidium magnivora]|uniref:Uncharacterized protein n=1 Tax=Hamiltosporidium magnivora TaxID=148818 RepID=A0A4Q9LDG0_9MICR|nr:hypothetical protein CWI39_0676p0020 [Hamiltosporidium magnivora]